MDINETNVNKSDVNSDINTSLVSDKFSFSSIVSEAWKVTKVKGVKSGILKSTILNEMLVGLIQVLGIMVYSIICVVIAASTGILAKIDFDKLKLDDPNLSPKIILGILVVMIPIIIYTIITSLYQAAIPFLVAKRSLNVIRAGNVDYKKLLRKIKNKFALFVSLIIYSMPMFFSKIVSTDEATGKASFTEFKQNLVAIIIMSFFAFLLYFLPLIVCDKEYKKLRDVFSSVWHSVKHILRHFVTYIVLAIFAIIVLILSVVLLFIPFLWTYPFLINTWAVAYEKEKF